MVRVVVKSRKSSETRKFMTVVQGCAVCGRMRIKTDSGKGMRWINRKITDLPEEKANFVGRTICDKCGPGGIKK